VHVDETRVAPGLVAPDPDQKIVARENASGLASQRPQELELRGRQRKLLVARDRLQAREIDDEPTKPELPVLAVIAVDAVTAQKRLDARGELVVVEWLAQVIIRTDAQTDDSVGPVVLRSYAGVEGRDLSRRRLA